MPDGRIVLAVTYVFLKPAPESMPYERYKAYLVRGAREHNLPPEYVALLEAVPPLPNPHRSRPSKNPTITGSTANSQSERDEGRPTLRARCEDGTVIAGDGYDELVDRLRSSMLTAPETLEEYMAGVKQRCKIYNGSIIDYEDTEGFVHELVRVGILRAVWVEGGQSSP